MVDRNYVGTSFGKEHLTTAVRSILFQGWEGPMLKTFFDLTRPEVRHYNFGSTVFKDGDVANGMYVILGGRIGIYKIDGEGISRELLHKAHPWSFGEAAVLGELNRNATVKTIEPDTQLMYIDKLAIAALSMSPQLSSCFYLGLAHELHRGQAIGNARLKDALGREARLEDEVIRLTELFGERK